MAPSNRESVNITLRRVVPAAPRTSIVRWVPHAPVSDLSLARIGIRNVIENEVIPRLALSHGIVDTPKPEPVLSEHELHAAAVRMAECANEGPPGALRAIADDLLGRGLLLEQLYFHVLAEAARHLGARWEDDTLDFLQVTVAVGCLQGLLRELAEEFQHETVGFASDRRILLLPTPGEAHGFGITMVAEVFRRRGWYVDSGPMLDLEELLCCVRTEWFDIVGLSLGGEEKLQDLAESIRHIRHESRNRRVGVLVGGPLFTAHPDWSTRVGADACGADALHAVEQAEQLVGLLVKSRD